MRRSPERHEHLYAARLIVCSLCLCVLVSACGSDKSKSPGRPPGPPVVVYAALDGNAARSIIDAYSDDTGVNIRLTTESGRALIDKLSAEKQRSTADLFISDSVAHLWTAVERDILRPSDSELLRNNVPGQLRDQENLWIGLRATARTIVYDKRSIDSASLVGYAELGDEKWRGKLCLSTSTRADNRSHAAMMIAEHGDRPTEMIVRSWIANLAIPIITDNARLLQEIDDGRCGLGIVNSDDAADYSRDNPLTSVAMYWPPASSGGAHIDIIGAAVTRHAGNPAGALHLLEWLSSAKARKLLAGENLDYQVSSVSLAGAGYYLEDALRLMDRAHWKP